MGPRSLLVSGLALAACLAAVVALLGGGRVEAAASDPVIAAAGDIACDPSTSAGSTTCQQMATSDLLVGASLAEVLTLGDNQYACGGYQAFLSRFDPSWGRIKSLVRPALGNHEYQTGTNCSPSGTAAGYFDYFDGVGSQTGPAGERGRGYYSHDVGSWHLIALNANCGPVGGCGSGSPQEQWLRADLAAHPAMCTLAYWHQPRFSSGGAHGNDATYDAFWKDLFAAGAEMILNGHDHDYERFAPQTPSQVADPGGIREFVVGTGGKSHTEFAGTIQANSEVRNSTTFGVLQLTLHPTSYDWSLVPAAAGSFTDSGTQACHGSGGGGGSPPAPSLSLSASDPTDFVSGSTVFYRQGSSAGGSFTVAAASAGATSVQFPTVFGADAVDDTVSPFSQTYTWNASSSASGPFAVTASNSVGASPATQFTVTPDTAGPSSAVSCNGASCSGSFTSPVSVSLSADDGGGSGVKAIYYTLDGSAPTTASPRYLAPFAVSSTTTVRYFAADNVGIAEPVNSQTVTTAGGGGGGVALVQQKVASGSGATLPAALPSVSGPGHALVAVVALAAGSSASVSSVSDSAGGAWTKGPVGFLTGVNSRVEIWYRLNAPPVSSVTVRLSAAKAAAVDVSEWSGVAAAAALDGSRGANGASSTSPATASLATSNPSDLVVGAINYPAGATSTLLAGPFASLGDLNASATVHGRAAYAGTSTAGAFQASWRLSAASGGHGTAILALKAG